jgi:radical SAM superfamily enzyme YgiQ (UPF0313 family)
MPVSPTKVLLVFPLFNPNSFWSFEAACEAVGARCPAPPLGLLTVAALLPQTWEFKLVDRNAETLEEEDLLWADLVMTGGMLPQRLDALAIMDRCKSLGKTVCVGGPDATSSPEAYSSADFLVLGEAEDVIGEFVSAWESGDRNGFFEAQKFQVDVTKSPLPRYDLLNFAHYLFIGVQFSRGCPFNCEFCDIIELYGQTPRSKTSEQMIAHLDRLYALGYRGHVDFVDDNLIGNKKALKRFLPVLKTWQQKRGYPFKFSTEASVNLADDPQLLTMMREANFFVIFVGLESPDADTLLSMQKKQNMRRSIEQSISQIYASGIFVLAGFIVGFDSEGDGVAEGMVECIEATSLPIAMVGLLTALPNTQLTRRLAKEGRLASGYDAPLPERGDQCTAGLNFVTLRPRREILKDYRDVLDSIYTPDAFFNRLALVSRSLRRRSSGVRPRFPVLAREITFLFRLSWWMTVNRPATAARFWRLFLSCARQNPSALECVVLMTGLYLHVGPFAMRVVGDLDNQIAALDRCEQTESMRVRQVTLA